MISREHPSSRVVMVTARDSREALLQGLEAGAVGFLTKPFSVDELKATLHEVNRGGFPIAAAIMAATARHGGDRFAPRVHLLTPLEKTIRRHLAEEVAIADIAARTGLSIKGDHRASVPHCREDQPSQCDREPLSAVHTGRGAHSSGLLV